MCAVKRLNNNYVHELSTVYIGAGAFALTRRGHKDYQLITLAANGLRAHLSAYRSSLHLENWT